MKLYYTIDFDDDTDGGVLMVDDRMTLVEQVEEACNWLKGIYNSQYETAHAIHFSTKGY